MKKLYPLAVIIILCMTAHADGGTFTVPDGTGGSISTIAQGDGIHKKMLL